MLPGIAAAPLGRTPSIVITGVSPADGHSTPVTVSGTADVGASITLYRGGTSVGTTTADLTAGAWNVAGVALSLGNNSLTATATVGPRTSPQSAPFVAGYALWPSVSNTWNGSTGVIGGASSVNLGTLSVGTADPSRLVALALAIDALDYMISSVSIGGVVATRVAITVNLNSGNASIWAAAVPNGGTANVTINFTGAHYIQGLRASLYSLYNLSSQTVYVTAGATADSAPESWASAAISAPNHSIVLAAYHLYAPSAYAGLGESMTGVTKDNSGEYYNSHDDYQSSDGGALGHLSVTSAATVTVTGSTDNIYTYAYQSLALAVWK